MKVTFSLVWFDAWIGAYFDQQKRILYICPLPCCVVKVEFDEPTPAHVTPRSEWPGE